MNQKLISRFDQGRLFKLKCLLCVWFTLLLLGSPWGVSAQSLSEANEAKTSKLVIENSKKGVAQKLFVVLDAKDIFEDEKNRLSTGQFSSLNQKEFEKTRLMFDKLKQEVFINDRMHNAEVIRNDRDVPLVLMNVPDFLALSAILSHPKVVSVLEIELYKPANSP